MKKLTLIFLFVFFFLSLSAWAQEGIRERLNTIKKQVRFREVDQFYQINQYQTVWDGPSQQSLFRLLQLSPSLGLNERDYQGPFMQLWNKGVRPTNANDSFELDIMFTDAALHFFSELKNGNQAPSFAYRGLNYNPSTGDVAALVSKFRKEGNLENLVQVIQPASREYHVCLDKLNWFQSIVNDPGFKEIKITSKKVSKSNKPLMLRLYQLGLIDSASQNIPDNELVRKLKDAQKFFDALNDGVLRSTSLAVLNAPLNRRIAELKLALNYLRWLEQIKQTSLIGLLNLPSAYLMVYDKGNVILDSKIVVGKKTTPTPTLTSTIREVILYPFWMVPKKIATRELLPAIKRNIGYLEDNNFQVLNRQGKVLDPYSINWHSLNTGYFPYIIRQCTGCDNSLGIIKFNFFNPFTVYLHDTPAKSLFSLNKRFFSHGCMRVEKPIELAHLVLGSNRIAIDTLTEKGCILQQNPIVVPVEKEMPLMVMYSTVWFTPDGELRFYDDIYEKLSYLLPKP